MTKELKLKDIARVVDAAKAELMVSMKQKEAVMHKLKFGQLFFNYSFLGRIVA